MSPTKPVFRIASEKNVDSGRHFKGDRPETAPSWSTYGDREKVRLLDGGLRRWIWLGSRVVVFPGSFHPDFDRWSG